jgi:hypothetical protein
VTQLGPARPGPARAPLAPLPFPCAPPFQDPFGSFDFSRAVTSLSFFHLSLSPRGALGFGVEIAGIWIPGGEVFPSPSLLSLSLSLPSSSPGRARPTPRAPRRAPSAAPVRPPTAAPALPRRPAPPPAAAPPPPPPPPPPPRPRGGPPPPPLSTHPLSPSYLLGLSNYTN